MANTTNLSLQKIEDTDYAGNFPTIYNNNLDLLDAAIAGKQNKLTAGDNITIEDNVISASGGGGSNWKLHTTASTDDLLSITKYSSYASYSIEVKKDIRFTVYGVYSEDKVGYHSQVSVQRFELPKGRYGSMNTDALTGYFNNTLILLYSASAMSSTGSCIFTRCGLQYNSNYGFILGGYMKYYRGEGGYSIYLNNPSMDGWRKRSLQYLDYISYYYIANATGISDISEYDYHMACIIEYQD